MSSSKLAGELSTKSARELGEQLLQRLEEYFQLRVQHHTGQLKQTHLLKAARAEIACIKTLINEKRDQAGQQNAAMATAQAGEAGDG